MLSRPITTASKKVTLTNIRDCFISKWAMEMCWAQQTGVCPAPSLLATHPSSFQLYLGVSWVFPLHSQSNPKASCFCPLRFAKGYLIIATVWVAWWYKRAHQIKCFFHDNAATLKIFIYLLFFFKTLLDCGYRNVSGMSFHFFVPTMQIHHINMCEKKTKLRGPLLPLTFYPFFYWKTVIDRDISTTLC